MCYYSSLKFLVSDGVNGNEIVDRLFWHFQGKSVFLPNKKTYYLQDNFVEWHFRQVFRMKPPNNNRMEK